MTDEPKIIEFSGTPKEVRRRVDRQQKAGQQRKRMVILCSNDPESTDWLLVKPEHVPDAIKEAGVMGNMIEGYVAQPPGSHLWYRAEPHLDYEKRVRRGYVLESKHAGSD